MESCRQSLCQHALWDMLAAMPQLEVLFLVFPEHLNAWFERGVIEFGVVLADVFSADLILPKLKTLHLSDVETNVDELLSLHSRHRDTLRVFELSNIRLLSSSWLDLLPRLRMKLHRGVIEKMRVSGFIYGKNPDPEVVDEIDDGYRT